MKPVALTPGEPAGIGPDLVLSLSRRDLGVPLTVIADADMLRRRAGILGIAVRIRDYDPGTAGRPHEPGCLTVLPQPLEHPAVPGRADPANAASLLAALDRAVDGCVSGEFSAMVTGPLHKAVINQAGYPFTGHTEYIAARCGGFPVMMLMNQDLRVALVTTHLPLSRVPSAITRDLLESVINIVHADLVSRFGIPAPKLLVCGINPHAGEQGYLGREELDTVEPVLRELQSRGLDLVGPVPADTAFTPDALRGIDAVISMYHDQGLPALKSRGFGKIVNITLGLPIIRTSVDHGTAFDLAGTGRARDGSLKAALECATGLATRRD